MVDKKIYLIGVLTIILCSSGVLYVQYESDFGDTRFGIFKDSSKIYYLDNGRWRVGGEEISTLWSGSTKINRDLSKLKLIDEIGKDNKTWTRYRVTKYLRGPTIIDEYFFDGTINKIDLVPKYHKITVLNATNYIYQYQILRLGYSEETKFLNGIYSMDFDHNIKVEWDEGNYYSKIYKYKGKNEGKLTVRYRIKSDYEVFYNRLFDPVSSNTTLYLDDLSSDRYYELGTICELKANVTNSTGSLIYNTTGNNICLNIDQVGYGDDFICGNGSVSYNLTTNAVKNSFNDSSLSKNLTYTNATENKTFYLNFNRYDKIQSACIDLEGFENTSYPLNTKIYVNNTLVDKIAKNLRLGNQTLNEFNNSNTTENLTFTGEISQIRYLYLPKYANLSTATINITPEEYWYSDSDFNPSHDIGSSSAPTKAFYLQMGGGNPYYWYIISGKFSGDFIGFKFTEGGCGGADCWLSNSAITSGLTDIGIQSVPEVFEKDSNWYLISGRKVGDFIGYKWNPSTYNWDSDTDIVAGLEDVGGYSTPTVFEKNSTWYLITGMGYDAANESNNGKFRGFNWTGSAWQNDTGIILGLGDVGEDSTLGVYEKDSTWYLISGERFASFYGFQWNGSSWNSDSSIVGGLTTGSISPSIFQKDSNWYLISGNGIGTFSTFQLYYPPFDSLIEVTGAEDPHEWNWSSNFTKNDGTQTANLNTSLINDYLLTCSEDNNGGCTVAIIFYSESLSVFSYSNLNITYTIDLTRDLTATAINTYLASQSSGFHNVPIKISSETNTIIQVDNINITYFGSDNISITAHFDGDGTYSASNSTKIIKGVYSGLEVEIPVNYGYCEFLPKSSDSQDVRCYGQIDSKCCLNISHYNYDKPANLSIRINQSLNCSTIKVSSNSSLSNAVEFNTSWYQITLNKTLDDLSQLWMWMDFNCSHNNWFSEIPYLEVKGICSECVKTT